jgi:leader peptidase (prepilin peptidase)/N-methyltransferase
MGMGDVKLALLLGVMLGWEVAVGLMVGMLAALVLGVVLIARNGMGARKTAIPFGPFLAFGSIVALFAGEQILSAYLGLF